MKRDTGWQMEQKRPVEVWGWKQISRLLGVSEPTARDWAKHKGLPVLKFGSGRFARVIGYADQLAEWRPAQLRPYPAARAAVPPAGASTAAPAP